MSEYKTVGNYDGPRHFVLKSQIENVLLGTDDHLTVYTKIGHRIRRVCNRTEANLDENEEIVEVCD